MSVQIIDGRKLAKDREEMLKDKVQEFVRTHRRKPTLVAIELSDDDGSRLYLKLKRAAAERTGIKFSVFKRTVLSVLKGPSFHGFDGIFVQHSPGFDKNKWQKLVDQIPTEKDVDCLTSENLRRIKEGRSRFLPATVKAVGYCLLSAFGEFDQFDQLDKLAQLIRGKRIVILGRSPIVGLPLSYWLTNLGGNVELLHSKTPGIAFRASCRAADILVSSVGSPGLVRGDMVKPGAIVIDCGSPRADVAFGDVAPKASAITPVPGGVGPLTVVSLMENVVEAAESNLISKIS